MAAHAAVSHQRARDAAEEVGGVPYIRNIAVAELGGSHSNGAGSICVEVIGAGNAGESVPIISQAGIDAAGCGRSGVALLRFEID